MEFLGVHFRCDLPSFKWSGFDLTSQPATLPTSLYYTNTHTHTVFRWELKNLQLVYFQSAMECRSRSRSGLKQIWYSRTFVQSVEQQSPAEGHVVNETSSAGTRAIRCNTFALNFKIDHSPSACWIFPMSFELANHQVFGWSTSWQTCSCTAEKRRAACHWVASQQARNLMLCSLWKAKSKIVAKQRQNQRKWLLNGLFGIFGIWSANAWAKDGKGDDEQISTAMTPDCKIITPECKQIALYIHIINV